MTDVSDLLPAGKDVLLTPLYEIQLREAGGHKAVTTSVAEVTLGQPLFLRCVDNVADGSRYSNDFIFWLHHGERMASRNGCLKMDTNDRRVSELKIFKTDQSFIGHYECMASNRSGGVRKAAISVRSKHRKTKTVLGEELCGPDKSDFCSNGGTCLFHRPSRTYVCRCSPEFVGKRCEYMETLVMHSTKNGADCNGRGRSVVWCSLIVCLLFLLVLFFALRTRNRRSSKADVQMAKSTLDNKAVADCSAVVQLVSPYAEQSPTALGGRPLLQQAAD